MIDKQTSIHQPIVQAAFLPNGIEISSDASQAEWASQESIGFSMKVSSAKAQAMREMATNTMMKRILKIIFFIICVENLKNLFISALKIQELFTLRLKLFCLNWTFQHLFLYSLDVKRRNEEKNTKCVILIHNTSRNYCTSSFIAANSCSLSLRDMIWNRTENYSHVYLFLPLLRFSYRNQEVKFITQDHNPVNIYV